MKLVDGGNRKPAWLAPCSLLCGPLCVILGGIFGLGVPAASAAATDFACGQPATRVHEAQGRGDNSPLAGQVVDIEAVVIGRFQDEDGLGGVFVEEEHAHQDQDPTTSEGLFLHTRRPARVGELVRARGSVAEFENLTQLQAVTRLEVCSGTATLPAATVLYLPLAAAGTLEAMENMRVSLPQVLTITDTWNLWQFGELRVSSTRLVQSTQSQPPGKSAQLPSAIRGPDAADLDRLIVDDGRNGQNLPIAVDGQDNASTFSAANPIRTGQKISGLAGILHYGFGNYRLQPTAGFHIDEVANPRAARPAPVGGALRVATFNVLNYFSTLSEAGPRCGPARDLPCRGANNPGEQKRQLQKLVAALAALDADLVGLLELENNPERSLQDLSDGLNQTLGGARYAYIASGTIGGDVIKVGLLFRPEAVTPHGGFALLDRQADGRFDDSLNRPALAQTFRVEGSGELLTTVVVHLKSKSCAGAGGPDGDQGDGQACFNRARSEAASALSGWALSDPTGAGTGRVLLIGDFNSYGMEDPIRILQEKGFVNLLAKFDDPLAYTYVYDGLIGTLDYAFSSPELAPLVTGATTWAINADEARVLEYNDEPGKPADYLADGPFRSSDHDPVIVGLQMGPLKLPTAVEPVPRPRNSVAWRYGLLVLALVLLVPAIRLFRQMGSTER